MFCKHCGKEISDEAFMCPNCGEPTAERKDKGKEKPDFETQNTNGKERGLVTIGFMFSLIAFITGIVFGAFFFVYESSILLLYVIGATTILPALAGLAMGLHALIASKNDNVCKSFAITSIVLSAFVLFFLFIIGCVFVGTKEIYGFI